MDRGNNFDWTKDRNKSLNYKTKNYQRRRKRLEEMGVDKELIPPPMFVKDLKKEIKTEADFNRIIARLDRMREDVVTEVVQFKEGKTSLYEIENLYKYDFKELREKEEERVNKISRIEVTAGGKPTGTTVGQMGNAELLNELTHLPNKEDIKSIEEFEKSVSIVKKRLSFGYFTEQDKLLRENFVRALLREYGNSTEVKELASDIMNMGLDDFVYYYFKDTLATFNFIYDMGSQDISYNLAHLRKRYRLTNVKETENTKVYSDDDWDNLLATITKRSVYYGGNNV